MLSGPSIISRKNVAPAYDFLGHPWVRLHVQDELDSHSVSREMSRGDGEKEARRETYGIRSVGRIYYYLCDRQCSAVGH